MRAQRRVVAAQTALRTGYGLAQVLVPGRLAAAVLRPRLRLRRSPRLPLSRVARVLGARHLAQALVCAAWPRRGVLRAGVAVDGLHAASMAALALASPRWRRAALAETCLAVMFAALGARAAAEVAGGEAARGEAARDGTAGGESAPRWRSGR